MIRRTYIIAILTVGITAGALYTSPVFSQLVSSAQSFHYYFRDLKRAGTSMNPVERFVFSFVFANPKAPQAQDQGAARRT